MNKLVITAAFAVLAGAAIWHWYPHPQASASSKTNAPTLAPAATITTSPTPPPQHVRKLASADERRELAAQIAAAQTARKAARASHHSALGAAESADQGSFGSGHEGDMDKDVIRDAMREVLPFLADCYSDARATTLHADHLDIRAHFTLTGDPDVGTIIDADQLFDDQKRAVPAKLDDCIRGTLQTLELPPLGDGDTIEVDYPLSFSDGPPADGSAR